jgi:HK97 family phage prohead protease
VTAELELRFFTQPVEIRSSAGGRTAYGYAAVFNQPAEIGGRFLEQVAPGAFSKTIREQDVRALFNHDRNHVLGRIKAGTLRLHEDAHGLAYEIDLPDTSVGRDVAELLRRGDVSGSSFGFRTIKESWSTTKTRAGNRELRTLAEAQLVDVGPVTVPAYAMAEAAVRSLATVGGPPVHTPRMSAEFGARASTAHGRERLSWLCY